MKLFWSPKTRSIRALWMLEETGVPYDRVKIDRCNVPWRSKKQDEFFGVAREAICPTHVRRPR